MIFVFVYVIPALMAIGGGILALRRPGVGGILMLLSTAIQVVWPRIGIIGLVDTITLLLVFPGGLLALASALTSRKKRPGVPYYVAMTLGVIGGAIAVPGCFFVIGGSLDQLLYQLGLPHLEWVWVPLITVLFESSYYMI